MDKTLKHNLDWLKDAVKQKWDGILLIDGMEGCLDSDTIIKTKDGNKKISECGEWNVVKCFNNDLETYSIAKFINTGVKSCYKMGLKDGRNVNATKDHTFFIKENNKIVERKLGKLKVGDLILCEDSLNKK